MNKIMLIVLELLLLIQTASSAVQVSHKVWPAGQVEQYQYTSKQPSNVLRTVMLDRDDDDSPSFQWIFSGDYEPSSHLLTKSKDRFLKAIRRKIPNYGESDLFNGYYPINPEKKDVRPLEGLNIHIVTNDTELKYGVDETYNIRILPADGGSDMTVKENINDGNNDINSRNLIFLTAETVYGAMHGLQTLLQLLDFVWFDDLAPLPALQRKAVAVFGIPNTPIYIQDTPSYGYRGLMIDTSRHFLPLTLILDNLDAMAMNKLNVLHWHLTDSQSWPYDSPKFPELAEQGAYRNCHPQQPDSGRRRKGRYRSLRSCTYSVQDIHQVVKQAAERGIRVVVEVDLPGHSQAIGASHPEFLSDCGNGRKSEPLDVTQDEVYTFVRTLYSELVEYFPDAWMHVGGDEVDLGCWNQSIPVRAWMKQHNMTEPAELLAYFEEDLLSYVTQSLNKRPVVWQELFDTDKVELPPGTVVDIWKLWELAGERERVTSKGYHVIVSAFWYLDYLDHNWEAFYFNCCNPNEFNSTSDEQKALVLGGHASMWGERVDATNFYSRVWPRASAAAEKLWSGNSDTAAATARQRLYKFRCFLLEQGFPASPISPGSCGFEDNAASRLYKNNSMDDENNEAATLIALQ